MYRRDVVISWLVTVSYMALIFIESSKSKLPAFIPTLPHFDKVLHFGAYFILSVLLYESLFKTGIRDKRAYWIALFVTSVYGLSDEFHQSFVPLREVSFYDWLADTVGGAVGALLWERRRKFHPAISTFKFVMLLCLCSIPVAVAAEKEKPFDPLRMSSNDLKKINRKPVKPMEKLVVKGSCTDPDGTSYDSDSKGYERCLRDQKAREEESKYLQDPNAPKNNANKGVEFRF